MQVRKRSQQKNIQDIKKQEPRRTESQYPLIRQNTRTKPHTRAEVSAEHNEGAKVRKT